MAIYTYPALLDACGRIPISIDTAMCAGLPIAVSRPVATTAQRRAVLEFQLPAIARLKDNKIGFIVAIETVVVTLMSAMAHHYVFMFLRNYDIVIGVKP